MDITAIKPSDRTIEIMRPGANVPLGIELTLISVDDERLAKVKRAITDKKLQLQRKGKDFTADDLKANKEMILLATIIDWRWYNPTGVEGDEGYDEEKHPSIEGDENPEHNPRNVRKCIALDWFADQVWTEIAETDEFFKNSNRG